MGDVFNQDGASLAELVGEAQGYPKVMAVLDNLDNNQMVDGVECQTNGTYPREGHQTDRNGIAYRWHNFMLVEGDDFDALKDEFGMEKQIDWQTLYDYGVTASQFERDLDKEVPRGATATVTIQKRDGQLNVLTHRLHIETADNVDRFSDNDSTRGTAQALNESAAQENGEITEEPEEQPA